MRQNLLQRDVECRQHAYAFEDEEADLDLQAMRRQKANNKENTFLINRILLRLGDDRIFLNYRKRVEDFGGCASEVYKVKQSFDHHWGYRPKCQVQEDSSH